MRKQAFIFIQTKPNKSDKFYEELFAILEITEFHPLFENCFAIRIKSKDITKTAMEIRKLSDIISLYTLPI